MVEIKGEHNTAKVYTDTADNATLAQIKTMCDQAFLSDATIRVMPDCHAGMGCTIGTTMTIKDKVVPGMVGVDISCGMHVVELADKSIDLERLDRCIRMNVPSGHQFRSKYHRWADQVDIENLRCWSNLKGRKDRKDQRLGISTLGGGNHFIEIDKGPEGELYLVIHSGSRNLGKAVAEYYQQAAYDNLHGSDSYHIARKAAQRKEIIDRLTSEGRESEIAKALESFVYDPGLPQEKLDVCYELSYCEGQLFDDYINDMKIMNQYASLNRAAIADTIGCGMRWEVICEWETIHNYIDTDTMILRKGAISAQKDEIAIIPMNMRDGSLIVRGKGNPDWNYSAPHGAGRLMSRSEARDTIPMQDYKDAMKGIFSTTVCTATKDEAPQAYKPMDEIIANIRDTCEIIKTIKPIYNFKAS